MVIKNNNHKNYSLLKEEKSAFITLSRISETNSSTNKNEIIKNMSNSNNNNNIYNKNINENIINNYLNTINVGYNGLSENNKNILFENEDEIFNNQINLECEPVPSFILCLKKTNNNM